MANKIRIITTGRPHDKLFEAAILEYTKRLSPYIKLEWKTLPPKTEATILQTITSEGNATLACLKEAEKVILLDEHGVQFNSRDFSSLLMTSLANTKDVSIVIGGAYGASEQLKARADATVSFGKMVLPHQLMRVVLAEQLYRSFMIAKGSDYHHD